MKYGRPAGDRKFSFIFSLIVFLIPIFRFQKEDPRGIFIPSKAGCCLFFFIR